MLDDFHKNDKFDDLMPWKHKLCKKNIITDMQLKITYGTVFHKKTTWHRLNLMWHSQILIFFFQERILIIHSKMNLKVLNPQTNKINIHT